MSMVASLIDLQRRCGDVETTWSAKRGWLLETSDCTWKPIQEPVTLPARIQKRGNTAKTKPNPGYDSVKYFLSQDGRFLPHFCEMAVAAGDHELAEHLIRFRDTCPFLRPGLHDLPKGAPPLSLGGHELNLEDWAVLTLHGDVAAMRPKVFAEFLRRLRASEQQGDVGTCIITGERGPIARLHPSIRFGRKGGSTTNLVSFNEGAKSYFGEQQGANCPTLVTNTLAYAGGLERSFEYAAFFTPTEALTMWPEAGTTHPAIPLISELASGYFRVSERARVDELWRQLEDLTDLDAEIHSAAMVHKMSRLSVRGYRVRTAGELRANMLAFRACFAEIERPHTFRYLLPYSTKSGEPSISGVCFLDAAWAILMGDPYPPHLLAAVRAQIKKRQLEVDWDSNDVVLSLALRWLDLLTNGKEADMTTNTELTDSERQTIEEFHDSVRQELEQRILTANSLLRVAWANDPSYRWGRFLAVSCGLKGYYHRIYGGRQPGRSRDEALKRGLAQPAAFVTSYRPQMYLEQVRRRVSKLNPLLNTYVSLLSQLSDPPPPFLTLKQKDLVAYGFLHQLYGLDKARTRKSSDPTLDLTLDDEEPSAA